MSKVFETIRVPGFRLRIFAASSWTQTCGTLSPGFHHRRLSGDSLGTLLVLFTVIGGYVVAPSLADSGGRVKIACWL